MAVQHGIWSILLAIIYLLIVPMGCGLIYRGRMKSPEDVLSAYLAGMVLMCAAFQLVAVPMILLHRSLHLTLWLWHAVLAGGLACRCACLKRKKTDMKDSQQPPSNEMEAVFYESGMKKERPEEMPWKELLLGLIVMVLLLLQCGFYIFGVHIDDDDARYVANAVEAYETDTMYHYHPNTGQEMDYFMGEITKEVASPIMIFYAGISRLTGVHPTIMIHTVWPVIWLCLGYIVLWKLSGVMAGTDLTKRLFFLVICMGLMIWGNTSLRQGPVFILTRLWQGKSLIPAVIAPCFLYLYLRGRRGGWRYYADLLGLSMFACLGSGMGIVLAAFYIALIAILHACQEKNICLLIGGGLCAVPNVCYAVVYVLAWRVILK